jgi:urea carboxylase-associated protein 2
MPNQATKEPAVPLLSETLRGGQMWSRVIKRGQRLRIIDSDGGAQVAALLFNAERPLERYNMPDTLKAQHIAKLTKGFVLYSDMGRVLCSVTEDTVGWHDPLGGTSNAAMVSTKYGKATYQDCHNGYHKNGRDSFVIELGKYGLGPRDLVSNVNFFSKVQVGLDGKMNFVPGHSKPGSYVELRAELNVLTILNTCQHPLDPAPKYDPKPVRLEIRRVAASAQDDACRNRVRRMAAASR